MNVGCRTSVLRRLFTNSVDNSVNTTARAHACLIAAVAIETGSPLSTQLPGRTQSVIDPAISVVCAEMYLVNEVGYRAPRRPTHTFTQIGERLQGPPHAVLTIQTWRWQQNQLNVLLLAPGGDAFQSSHRIGAYDTPCAGMGLWVGNLSL